MTYELSTAAYSVEASLGEHFLPVVLTVAKEVFIALALIVVFFGALQWTVLKLPMVKLVQVGVGILYTFVGLVIFLTAVTVETPACACGGWVYHRHGRGACRTGGACAQ